MVLVELRHELFVNVAKRQRVTIQASQFLIREATKRETGLTGSIWEIEAGCVYHRGDMRLLTPERCNDVNLRAYWEGRLTAASQFGSAWLFLR